MQRSHQPPASEGAGSGVLAELEDVVAGLSAPSLASTSLGCVVTTRKTAAAPCFAAASQFPPPDLTSAHLTLLHCLPHTVGAGAADATQVYFRTAPRLLEFARTRRFCSRFEEPERLLRRQEVL